MHYHLLCLNKYSTEDDLRKSYHKPDLQSHPNKNKHQQASASFCMTNEAKQGLEDVLCHNDEMRRAQEREQDI